MAKNPFSLYDFMGYFFPGVIVVCFVLSFLYIVFPQINLEFVFSNISSIERFSVFSIVLIVVSYTIGHLISYLSSVTVEKFTIFVFGYPTKFLLDQSYKTGLISEFGAFFTVQKSVDSNNCVFVLLNRIMNISLKLLIFIFLLPCSFLVLTFGNISGMNLFLTRPLERKIICMICKKKEMLAKKLSVEEYYDDNIDFHRVIMHYVYNHQPNCQRKVDNYIAIYGFFRCITFILCAITDVIFFVFVKNYGNCDISNYYKVLIILLLCITSYVSYLGFTKFYRRFTLENYMTLLTDSLE